MNLYNYWIRYFQYDSYNNSWILIKGYSIILIISCIADFIIKVLARKKRYTKEGYYLLISSFVLFAISTEITALLNYGTSTALVGIPISLLIILPNYLYIRKRRELFGFVLDVRTDSNDSTQTETRVVKPVSSFQETKKNDFDQARITINNIIVDRINAQTEKLLNRVDGEKETEESTIPDVNVLSVDCDSASKKSDDAVEMEIDNVVNEPMIRYCRKCGFKLLEGSVFCSRCGARVL